MNGDRGYEVLLHVEVEQDLRAIPKNMASRVLGACHSRLGSRPDLYGERLRRSLRGYWKLRVGDYRVVYEIVGQEVRVHSVMHRRDVYDRVQKRILRGWMPQVD